MLDCLQVHGRRQANVHVGLSLPAFLRAHREPAAIFPPVRAGFRADVLAGPGGLVLEKDLYQDLSLTGSENGAFSRSLEVKREVPTATSGSQFKSRLTAPIIFIAGKGSLSRSAGFGMLEKTLLLRRTQLFHMRRIGELDSSRHILLRSRAQERNQPAFVL